MLIPLRFSSSKSATVIHSSTPNTSCMMSLPELEWSLTIANYTISWFYFFIFFLTLFFIQIRRFQSTRPFSSLANPINKQLPTSIATAATSSSPTPPSTRSNSNLQLPYHTRHRQHQTLANAATTTTTKQFRPVASHAPAQNVTAGTRLVVETLTQDSAGSRAAKETKWQTKPKPRKKKNFKKNPVSASMPALNLDARASKRAARPTDRPSVVSRRSIDRSIACKKEHWRIAIKRASVVLQEWVYLLNFELGLAFRVAWVGLSASSVNKATRSLHLVILCCCFVGGRWVNCIGQCSGALVFVYFGEESLYNNKLHFWVSIYGGGIPFLIHFLSFSWCFFLFF